MVEQKSFGASFIEIRRSFLEEGIYRELQLELLQLKRCKRWS
jgi:hypothetical protein